jgi:uncharacterized membrane protein
MNKELLNENLKLLLEGLKTVIHTANAELPAILEEIVRLGIIKSSLLTIITLVLLLLFVGATILLIKKDRDPLAITATVVVSLLLVIWFTIGLLSLINVLVAPKLYIIHHLKNLIQ